METTPPAVYNLKIPKQSFGKNADHLKNECQKPNASPLFLAKHDF
jgi:hypothetical protein